MKIKMQEMTYEEVIALPKAPHKNPKKPNPLLKRLIKFLADIALKEVNFKCDKVGMDRLEPGTPCLVLMNHSSFIDLEIAAKLLYPNPFQIVCTSDGFVGKEELMRSIGCIPTQKFVTDLNLIKDMKYSLETLKSSVLMYPEASYSFDGTKTPLPESLGKCIKLLGAPVIMITTRGAFTRDPLYNMLQIRKCDVSAKMEYLLSPEAIKRKSVDEINAILDEQFSFDQFKWQQDNNIKISEGFRADGLNRVLYKCPHCMTESQMVGKGIMLTCGACNAAYELDEYGYLKGVKGTIKKYNHVPDWFKWERE
ncbi:MAG: 1-acyl-sn-glycerol-3-phosphate acyltransferase, partial [Lachnospiraceae bacterium]|nr:1-acyl-sn-glycerol-3-phosphate acyltransferase [Lachnospiraceae bacterium]